MTGDRQDFLERREARQRRLQQRAEQKKPGSRTAQPSEPAPKARQPEQPSKQSALGAAPGRARQKAKPAEPAKRQAPPGDLDDLDVKEPSPVGGLAGRRAAARRKEQTAGLVPPLPARPKPSLLARLILWGTAAICGLLILATLGEAWTVYRLNQQIAANQQTVNQLQAQNQQLSNSVQQLQQDSTIEAEARRLGFIFPGDQPVVIVTTTPPAASPSQTPSTSPDWWGFWPDWLKLFFGG